MTAKEYLSQAYFLDRRIDSKLTLLSGLKEMATKTTSILNDMVVARSRDMHSMEETVVKIVEMQEEINRDIDVLVDLKKNIMACIRNVADPEQQMLLEQRYLCFQSWEQISERMGYSVNNIYRMHGKALKEIKIPKVESFEHKITQKNTK